MQDVFTTSESMIELHFDLIIPFTYTDLLLIHVVQTTSENIVWKQIEIAPYRQTMFLFCTKHD